jgi:hypothetical protein
MFNQYEQDKPVYATGQSMMPRRVTIREEIGGTIKHLEEQLRVKREMLTLLDQNPAIEKFMDLSRS